MYDCLLCKRTRPYRARDHRTHTNKLPPRRRHHISHCTSIALALLDAPALADLEGILTAGSAAFNTPPRSVTSPISSVSFRASDSISHVKVSSGLMDRDWW